MQADGVRQANNPGREPKGKNRHFAGRSNPLPVRHCNATKSLHEPGAELLRLLLSRRKPVGQAKSTTFALSSPQLPHHVTAPLLRPSPLLVRASLQLPSRLVSVSTLFLKPSGSSSRSTCSRHRHKHHPPTFRQLRRPLRVSTDARHQQSTALIDASVDPVACCCSGHLSPVSPKQPAACNPGSRSRRQAQAQAH